MVEFGLVMIINLGCCVVVRVTTILRTAVLPIAFGSTRSSTSTASGFGLSAVLRRGLFSPLHSCPFALYPFFFTLSERSEP